MHSKNLHASGYDLENLATLYTPLRPFILKKTSGESHIDFSNYKAVKILNEALLQVHYNIRSFGIPDSFLIPPVPSRADYIHHLAELTQKSTTRVLDIGTGASLIYPLLGSSIYNWKFKTVDVNPEAIKIATKQLVANPDLNGTIEIMLQPDRGCIFKNVLLDGEHYTFTMCNPPFYSSENEALKANNQKNRNLGISMNSRNFNGISNELWCNGGEALFIKRMIKESILFKTQVQWFTCLISKSSHLPKIYKQLEKSNATYKTIPMEHGKKKTRFVAWQFTS